jgi:hypothetical protein
MDWSELECRQVLARHHLINHEYLFSDNDTCRSHSIYVGVHMISEVRSGVKEGYYGDG